MGKLQAAVVALHAKHSGGGGGGSGSAAVASLGHGDDSEEVSGALRLLLVYAELSAGLGVLEAEIRCDLWGTHELVHSSGLRGHSDGGSRSEGQRRTLPA